MNAFNPDAEPRHEGHEAEPQPATIRLEFFRHDAKEKESTSGPRKEDAAVRLTPEGRQHATEAGKHKDPHPEVSIAYGSPRDRAQETALRHMLANDERITRDSSLEDIQELVTGEGKEGHKDKSSDLLDFQMEADVEYGQVANMHYLEKKDLLDWLRKDSDELVERLHDTNSSSYSRMAANVAQLVQKYVTVYPRWQQIVADDPQKYAQFDNELQRHFGSHQSVTESFLLKVVEKTDGEGAADELVNSLASRNGFNFSEGFSVEITGQSNPRLVVRFRDKQWVIPPETIQEIIAERR